MRILIGLIIMIGSFGSFASAEHPADLIVPAPIAVPLQIPNAVRVQAIGIEPQLLTKTAPTHLNIDLFGDHFVLVRDRIEIRTSTNRTWFGKVAGFPLSTVVLLVDHDEVVGSIQFGGNDYRVWPIEAGIAAIGDVQEPDTEPDQVIESTLPDSSSELTLDTEPVTPKPDANPTITVNLLFWYTANAESLSPSQTGTTILNAIQLATDYANQGCVNSNAGHRYANVGQIKTSYTESGTQSINLSRMWAIDGYMDDILVQKNSYGADITVLITSDAPAIAFGLTSVSQSFAPQACAALNIGGLVGGGGGLLPHEVGHVFGLRHEWQEDSNTGLYSYCHGYGISYPSRIVSFDGFHDLMSYGSGYSCTGACDLWLGYSNPLLYFCPTGTTCPPQATYQIGIPEGSGPQPSDCVRALANTAPTVATFRSYLSTCAITMDSYTWSTTYASQSKVAIVHGTYGCRWTAASNAAWITLTFPGQTYYGEGGVQFSISENTGQTNRTGTITITPVDGIQAPFTYTIQQAYSSGSCTVTCVPTGVTDYLPTSGATGSFQAQFNSQGCSFTTASSASWFRVTSGGSGIGNTTVYYSVDANSGAGNRYGSITVTTGGSQAQYAVAQYGLGSMCNINLNPWSYMPPAAGGTSSFTVSVGTGSCPSPNYVATATDPSWVHITSGGSGSTFGTVGFTIDANPLTTSRSAYIQIVSGSGTTMSFVISQLGAGQVCNYSVGAFSQSLTADGQSIPVAISTSAGCPWAAGSSVDWIAFSPNSGTGTATPSMIVQANSVPIARTGTVTIVGTDYTINQAASGVTPPPTGGPTITTIKAKTAKAKSAATIYGTGFSTVVKKDAVYFGTKKARIGKAKATSLKVTIPKVGKGMVSVKVVVNGKTSNMVQFQVK